MLSPRLSLNIMYTAVYHAHFPSEGYVIGADPGGWIGWLAGTDLDNASKMQTI